MKWSVILIVLVLAVPLLPSSSSQVTKSFFIKKDGRQNCMIVVGQSAEAADIMEASRLAVAIGELSAKPADVPVVEKVSVHYENVGPGTCIVVTPSELNTLWYFDDFGVYGNMNEKYQQWESHEEIQLYIEDIREFDPLLRRYRGDGFLDFSTIYRMDNVRAPPYLWMESFTEGSEGEHITGLHYQKLLNFIICDPFFVYQGYLPEICIFDTVYTVVYIDTSLLITGDPSLEYVHLYKDQPFRAGHYTISLLDVDVDHNKCHLRVEGPQTREEFWMVLDPLHGFSSDIQERGPETDVKAIDFNNDGVIDHLRKTTTGLSELDVWGHTLFGAPGLTYGIADLVIDGIKIFIGEDIGVYMGVYWVDNAVIWREKTCCDPFVKFPSYYNFQIRPDIIVLEAAEDAFVDQSAPAQNFGGLPFLSVRSFQNANTRSFVRFNLPRLPEKAIITRAILRLTPLGIPPVRLYEVSRVSSSWSEFSISWSNQPGAVFTGTQINALMEWDVTLDVQGFYTGTAHYGWRISDQSENSLLPQEAQFGSRESLRTPQLVIEYTFDCNSGIESIPHILNWINTFYDDVDNDGIRDSVYEIDISLCEPVNTLCTPYFFEGPNYYYFVDFSNTSFDHGVDFTVYQTKRVHIYERDEVSFAVWDLIKLDTEITEKDAMYNWILIGGMYANVWVKHLVDRGIAPDDGSSVNWFIRERGYKLYSDPFRYYNRIIVVAGRTSKDTQKAIQMLVQHMKTFT